VKTNELIDKLMRASDGEDCLAVAARLISEAYRTGFITEDGRVQRYPEQAHFITKDGKQVKPFEDAYVAGSPCGYEISDDGTVAYSVTELIDGHVCVRDLRADECFSTKAAAIAAKAAKRRRAGK
jgi:hypothetical protein